MEEITKRNGKGVWLREIEKVLKRFDSSLEWLMGVIDPREEEIEIDGNKVLVTHGHYYGVSMDISGVAEEAASRDCQAVFFGHTHKPVVEEIDGVLAINPGSLSYPRQQGRRPSYVVLETDSDGKMNAEIRYL